MLLAGYVHIMTSRAVRCGTKTKYVGSSALTPTDNPPHEKIIPFKKERE
ncbi:hypothetical protein [Ruminococcus sp. YE282]